MLTTAYQTGDGNVAKPNDDTRNMQTACWDN